MEKRQLAVFSILLILLGSFRVAGAFHEGGTGVCSGCHSMHSGNKTTLIPAGNSWLNTASDPGSTCLRCHSQAGTGYNIMSTDGSSYTPGGDFYWLRRDYQWIQNNARTRSPRASHGHNIVAVDYGLAPDPDVTAAPGGTYVAAALGCTSCHDPHGQINGSDLPVSVSGSYGQTPGPGTIAGNYRLLGAVGYEGGPQSSGFVFQNPAPAAISPALSNPTGAGWRETDNNHVAYGAGMSEWCGNCHPAFLNNGEATNHRHKAGSEADFSREVINSYRTYVKTGDSSGVAETSYLALVPFEAGSREAAVLSPGSTRGPETGANVMCLSCHRAHASAFPNAGRWDFSADFIIYSHPNGMDDGSTPAEKLNSYYGRQMEALFGATQRSLCNKCHKQD